MSFTTSLTALRKGHPNNNYRSGVFGSIATLRVVNSAGTSTPRVAHETEVEVVVEVVVVAVVE